MNHSFRQTLLHCLLVLAIIVLPLFAYSEDTQESEPETFGREAELDSLISDRTSTIEKLEQEIIEYQQQLKTIDGEKKSLQNQIKSLDITKKKLVADLSVTENKITKTSYELESFALDIHDKEGRINASRMAIAHSLKIINEYDAQSFAESVLSSENFSEVWEDVEMMQHVQNGIGNRIASLYAIKIDLEGKQTESTKIKNELTKLKTSLSHQKKVIEYNAKEKNTLLATTKNSETNYQKLLKEKTAVRDAFEKELLEFESELKLLKDPSAIPEANQNTLSWPLDFVVITQYFGNTKFARDNPQVYSGRGHNGIDFRASVGTSIKAARGGEVTGTGDTDTVCDGASYGKWVLIKHGNGLSTLYAHLSVISVNQGDAVNAGSVIGYSGDTGYSTGPHLHFTVYATQGVLIAERKSRVCGKTYRMPIADLRAYLNPISYLPELP